METNKTHRLRNFSWREREENLIKLQQQEFDLLIIGGGVNGAGIARDASLRGMKVALVEASDYASGTSSRSSKLVHGGIRYLENLEFKLVFEALNERTKLFEMVPHLAHPLRFMIPIYDSSRVGAFKLGLGMWAYDMLAVFQSPEFHEYLSYHNTIERVGILNNVGLKSSFVYSDGYMDDDRLVHETLRSAHAEGAVLVNYVKASDIAMTDGKISSVQISDQLSAQEFYVRCKHVISAVGPWTDQLGQELFKKWKNVLRPTKGVHLTFSKDRVALDCAVVMAVEKRIVFAIPRHEMVIIGTTDTDYPGDPAQVAVENEDVEYLLGVANQYFPGARLTREDILAAYAGVRPLVKDENDTPGKTSREHVIWNDERGITFIAGGKYTTYRLISQQTVDKALHAFPIEARTKFLSANSERALNPWTDWESYQSAKNQVLHRAEEFGRAPECVQQLIDRYGLEAVEILKTAPAEYSYWQIEALQAIQTTQCLNLIDFYTRRVHLFLAERDHGLGLIEEISSVFCEHLGWDMKKAAEQKTRLLKYFSDELRNIS